MPNNYPPEFRGQMVELVRAGRTPEELAKEFQPSAQPIRGIPARRPRRRDQAANQQAGELFVEFREIPYQSQGCQAHRRRSAPERYCAVHAERFPDGFRLVLILPAGNR
ncbi:hypothetical protein [Nonomuraea sp. CA-141351]|uniref:hypothetical protein n=1 Tax=Nonomuraea sp. CA-141351 TaxID=3239996 RepID=UPI003D905246